MPFIDGFDNATTEIKRFMLDAGVDEVAVSKQWMEDWKNIILKKIEEEFQNLTKDLKEISKQLESRVHDLSKITSSKEKEIIIEEKSGSARNISPTLLRIEQRLEAIDNYMQDHK